MKTLPIAAALLAVAAPALLPASASAAPWQTVNQRQSSLYQRIDTGVRTGALTRNEARTLKARFQTIVRVEQRYRASNGLDMRERRDLDSRMDALSRDIRVNRHDRQTRRR